jgi:hypothetical protein
VRSSAQLAEAPAAVSSHIHAPSEADWAVSSSLSIPDSPSYTACNTDMHLPSTPGESKFKQVQESLAIIKGKVPSGPGFLAAESVPSGGGSPGPPLSL